MEAVMRGSRRFLGSLSLVVLVGIAAFSVRAQQAAQMKVDHDGAIEAGSTVTFTVKLDKIPNVNVNAVSLSISPVRPDPDVPGTSGGGGAMNAERTVYKIPVTIPVTARAGTWHVTSLVLGIPSAPNKLLKFNEVSFEVKEKRDIILPDSGSIEISK
jgi:hypothetical protein